MRSAVRWLKVVGAPIFFGALEAFAGVMAPLALLSAFGALEGLSDPLTGVSYTPGLTIFSARVVFLVLAVSGMTRIPFGSVDCRQCSKPQGFSPVGCWTRFGLRLRRSGKPEKSARRHPRLLA